MSFSLLSPIRGTFRYLSTLDDPVFAGEIIGPGFAVTPEDGAVINVHAPTSGKLTHLLPHACALTQEDGQQILVHLGIDTVNLDGAGFSPRCAIGDVIAQGNTLFSWDTTAAREAGYALDVIVIAMAPPNSRLELLVPNGAQIDALMPGAHVHRA